MDVIFTHCAGLDVHKKTVMACRVTPDPTGAQADGILELKEFGAMTVDLLALSDWLAAAGITHVAMESTGEYTPPGMLPKRYWSGNMALRLCVPACSCARKSSVTHHLATPYRPTKAPVCRCRSIVWPSHPLSIARRQRSPSCLSHTASNTTSSRPSISCWFRRPEDA
jgi:hypothetical protein